MTISNDIGKEPTAPVQYARNLYPQVPDYASPSASSSAGAAPTTSSSSTAVPPTRPSRSEPSLTPPEPALPPIEPTTVIHVNENNNLAPPVPIAVTSVPVQYASPTSPPVNTTQKRSRSWCWTCPLVCLACSMATLLICCCGIVIAAIAVGASLGNASWKCYNPEFSKTIARSFPASDYDSIKIQVSKSYGGFLDVVSSDAKNFNSIQFQIQYKTPNEGDLDEFEINYEYATGKTLSVSMDFLKVSSSLNACPHYNIIMVVPTSKFFETIEVSVESLPVEVGGVAAQSLVINNKRGTTKVTASSLNSLVINGESGDIVVARTNALSSFKATTRSASIETVELYSTKAAITTVSGAMTIKNFTGAGIELKTSSGDVNVFDSSSSSFVIDGYVSDINMIRLYNSKSIMASTTSGSVYAEGVNMLGSVGVLSVRTNTGSIHVAKFLAGSLDLASGFGDIEAEARRAYEGKFDLSGKSVSLSGVFDDTIAFAENSRAKKSGSIGNGDSAIIAHAGGSVELQAY